MHSTMAGSMSDDQRLEALSFKLTRPHNLPFRTSPTSLAANLPPARQIRALLEVLAPQVHQGDHETTAAILHTGTQESVAMELVRLLIYFESNNMGREFSRITGSNSSDPVPADIMEFLRGVGFLTHANINWLGTSASVTSDVFLERLLFYSIFDENSFYVLEWLVPGHSRGFDVNHSVRIDFLNSIHYPQGYDAIRASMPEFGCLLQASALAGNIHAVQHLLGLGADFSNNCQQGDSPLVCAASLRHHDRAAVIVDMLLRKQTYSSSEFREKDLEGAFQFAIARGNAALVKRLLLERKRLGHGTIRSQHLTIAVLHAHADCDMIRLLADHAERCSDGSIMLPKDILFSVFSNIHTHDDSDFLLDMLECLLDLGADPAVSMGCEGCDRGFLLDSVVRFFLRRKRGHVKKEYALRMVKTLRKHGCPWERPRPKWGVDHVPSALQRAIASGDAELVEYLLDWGLDINHCRESIKSGRHKCEDCDTHDYVDQGVVEGRSPLLTALRYGEIEIAKTLLTQQPNLKLRGGEWELAMEVCDDPELVTMLLQAGSENVNGWKDFLEEAIRMQNPESIKLLLSMNHDGHGAVDPTTILRVALITGDHDKIYQQLAVCDYNSGSLFEAVLQTHRAGGYHQIVEHLLESRPKSPNDEFEILAVAFAAASHNMYLLDVLMRKLQEGPWMLPFPHSSKHGTPLSRWTPGRHSGRPMHILEYAASLDKDNKDAKVLDALLKFNVSAEGICIDPYLRLAAETWKQLIAAGADPNAGRALFHAVENNLLEHVQVLCEAKVTLNTMKWDEGVEISRTATQVAVEAGSPKMLQMLPMLLHYGADIGHPAGAIRGATCLQLAAGAGNIGLLRFLLEKGAKVNAKRSFMHGRTAIEIAAENGRLDVLKLLLLQGQDLSKTTAERYQFIRAVKLAEAYCHGPINKMLKEHINWNSDDQRLFDEMHCSDDLILCLDEMTQKPMDSEREEIDFTFWRHEHDFLRQHGIRDVYDIDGIEMWIGKRPGQESDDWTTSRTECSSVEEEDDLASEDPWPTDQYRNVSQERVVSASGHRRRGELHSDRDQPGELVQASDSHDASADLMDLQGHLMGENTATSRPEWRLNTGSREETRVLAPSAVRHDDNIPSWLDAANHGPDSTMQGVIYDRAPQGPTWESLTHRDVTLGVIREPGMVLGEVLGGVPQISGIVDDPDFVDHENSGNVGEASHIHVQNFNWGFWDED